MDDKLKSKLQKLLALTTSPNENEADTAAQFLHRLLEAHNLDIAALEEKGAPKRPVLEQSHDLGKAAFKWKLTLARSIAEHYYCWPLIDDYRKTVTFIGRPDNVESLQMLYGWLIDQIRRIASEERKKHHEETGIHIDPLRWQCGFGEGASRRLGQRLKEQREKESSEAGSALAIYHKSEISDYLENRGLRRIDGKRTKAQEESDARFAEYMKERERELARLTKLKEEDIEAYYRECPWDTPEARAERAKREEAARKREERNAKRRKGRTVSYMSDAEYRSMTEKRQAREIGHQSADRINLTPFLNEGKVAGKLGS